jgi:hypothetical protein
VGVLKVVVLPNFSATVVANGNTVDEPTILMLSRAAFAVVLRVKTAAAIKAAELSFFMEVSN